MDLNRQLREIRKDYDQHSLDPTKVPESPMNLFQQWMQEALENKVMEPNAFNLATVGENNRPSVRVVLLRAFSEEGFSFYTNYTSRKGHSLSKNPFSAMNFFWPELERQVRIEGQVIELDKESSDEYFESRPLDSKLGAWASHQSQPLGSRKDLEERFNEYKVKFGDKVPRPPHWGGYILKPDYFEFWQGRSNRLHDRLAYRKEGNTWISGYLNP